MPSDRTHRDIVTCGGSGRAPNPTEQHRGLARVHHPVFSAELKYRQRGLGRGCHVRSAMTDPAHDNPVPTIRGDEGATVLGPDNVPIGVQNPGSLDTDA